MNKSLFVFACLFLVSLFHCKPEDEPQGPVLTSLVIAASQGTRLDLSLQETTQLVATGRDASNQTIQIDEPVTWQANNTNVSVDATGLVKSMAVGKSAITARTGNVSKQIELSVWDSSLPHTEIFISDAGPNYQAPWQILRVYDDGDYTEVFTSSNVGWPQDIVVLESEGVVLVSNYTTNDITKFNLNDGAFLGVFATGLNAPTRMEIGPDRLLYVLEWNGTGYVQRFQLDGTPLGRFTDAGVNESIGMAWDNQRNLYVSSFSQGNGSSFVRKFDRDGHDQGYFIHTDLQGATDIWFDGSDLLVNDYSLGVVKRFDQSGAFVSNFITGLNLNEGIDHLTNGNILIGNGGTHTVKLYTAGGAFIKDLIPMGTQGLATPNAVTVRNVIP